LQGNISVSVAFEGPPNKPVIDGELFLHDIQGNYRAYNTFFRIPEEKIQFNSSRILLDDFIAYDSLGNKARINGQIHTADYRKYSYDLGVKMDHFMALNKKSTPEQEYYGPAFLSSDLRISSTNDG
jgi:autotransporter translocation and assembly factor TamB